MAASQARFLQLTSRKTNIEYMGQQINQQRLSLANASAGLFEKMLSIVPPTPPSSQDDKYYTQGYNFTDQRDGLQKKIFWQTYDEAIAAGAPPAASYYAPALGLDIKSVVDGTTHSFAASVIANPTDAEKADILTALGINSVAPVAGPTVFAGYDEAHTITSAADFITKIQSDMAGDFIIANDLDFSGIALSHSAITGLFTGSLDGNGNTIDGLQINSIGGTAIGLFSNILPGGSISNLTMTNANININGFGSRAGVLVGLNSGGTINNCNTVGSLISVANSFTQIGGLVGQNSGNISNSSADTLISGGDNNTLIGGLVGSNTGGIIQSSYSAGIINLGDNSSGIGGFAASINNSTIENSYSTVTMYLGANAGVRATTPADSTYWGVGGFAGQLRGSSTITNSYAASSIVPMSGELYTDAFVGYTNGGNVDDTNFYDSDINPFGYSGTVASGTFNPIGLASIDINVTNAPIDSYDTTIWDTGGGYPSLRAVSFTPLGSGSGPAASSDSGTRQEIRYITIENPIYNPDGSLETHIEQGIAVLEFDNLNRLLRVTSLTDKSFIDATNGASATDEPLIFGDGDALTYTGKFDDTAYQNDVTKYEFQKASYDYQLENINKETRKIQSQDKSLELKMKQLDTEHNAVQTELEAVSKVIQKNTENSFKTFA